MVWSVDWSPLSRFPEEAPWPHFTDGKDVAKGRDMEESGANELLQSRRELAAAGIVRGGRRPVSTSCLSRTLGPG